MGVMIHLIGAIVTFCLIFSLLPGVPALPTANRADTAFEADEDRLMLVGAGSSVPLPLYRKWSDEYNDYSPAVHMGYIPMGTSDGISQLTRRVGDFAAGEAPLSPQQRKMGLLEVPVAVIAIVPIYNLPQLHDQLRLSGEVLAAIFMGEIRSWDAREIAHLNPGVSLPHLTIDVVHRPAGKGTNYVFTEFLSKTSPRFRQKIGTTVSPHWPIGVPAERSSDMAEFVKRTPGAIGYVELQYAMQDKIPHAAVLNRAGHFVVASVESVAIACQEIEAPTWENFSASLTNPPGNDSYPIASFTWFYFRPGDLDSKRGKALAGLLDWIFGSGQKFATHLGYAEVPPPLILKAKTKLAALQQQIGKSVVAISK